MPAPCCARVRQQDNSAKRTIGWYRVYRTRSILQLWLEGSSHPAVEPFLAPIVSLKSEPQGHGPGVIVGYNAPNDKRYTARSHGRARPRSKINAIQVHRRCVGRSLSRDNSARKEALPHRVSLRPLRLPLKRPFRGTPCGKCYTFHYI
jgi:hypothetical protein